MPDSAARELNLTVIGAGVIGLSCAFELAEAGHRVRIISDQDTADTVSSVAAAIWFPYHSERSEAAQRLLTRSLERFEELAADPATGVDLRAGINVEHRPGADRSWTEVVTNSYPAQPSELPAGAHAGDHATVPVITTGIYLQWLKDQLLTRGVQFMAATVADLNDLAEGADAVICATGLRGGELLGGDEQLYPIRGQVVRIANPKSLTNWLCDDEHPDGVTYIIPRRGDIILGGTDVAGDWNRQADPDTARAIIERAVSLMPELEPVQVLEHKTGLRPAREAIRLEPVAGYRVPVIAAYGHGGAGVTLSWGTAEAVRAMVEQIADAH